MIDEIDNNPPINAVNTSPTTEGSRDLLDKIKELERQAEENFAGWQRARADYQNLKKEWEKKQTQFMVEAKKILLVEILPIYDHLKQAMSIPHNSNHFLEWRRGIEQIKGQWDALLKRWQVEEVPTVGEKFDPQIHEAVEHQDSRDETISRELQGGYRVEGQLLYPARVVVGIQPNTAQQEEKNMSDNGVPNTAS